MDLTGLLRERFGFAEFRPAQQQVIDTWSAFISPELSVM